MGHHCCSKQKVKRGLWSPEEDDKLTSFITTHGHGCWSSVPKQAGLQRCGKSCRLRWINYLRPDLKRGSFTALEERIIIDVHRILGNRWAQIAKHLPGRTDNEVKNFWNSCIKKKLIAQGLDPKTHNLIPSSRNNSSFHPSQFQHTHALPPPFTISSSIKNSDTTMKKTSMDMNPPPPLPPPITLPPTTISPHETTTLMPNFHYQDPYVLMSFKDQNPNFSVDFSTRPASFDHEQVSSSFNPLAFMDNETSMWTTTSAEPVESLKEKGLEQQMACKMDFIETNEERGLDLDSSYNPTCFDLELMESALMPCGVFCNASSMDQLEWDC